MLPRQTFSFLLLAILAAALAAGPSQAHALLPPPGSCAFEAARWAPGPAQHEAMLCLTGAARRTAGLAPLAEAAALNRSAFGKSGDILRCNSFSHHACGRDFTYWMRQSGYLSGRCWRTAENLAWGVGDAGTPRAIFRAWLHSPAHRRNILTGRFAQIGVSLRTGRLRGMAGTRVWTQHFGSRCR